MKKWYGGVFIGSLFVLLILRYCVMRNPFKEISSTNSITSVESESLKWQPIDAPELQSQEADNQVIPADIFVADLFDSRNFSYEAQNSLLTWNHTRDLLNYSQGLPNTDEAIREGRFAWKNLMDASKMEQHGDLNQSSVFKGKGKHCPHFLNTMNTAEFGSSSYKLRIPCGLTQDSAITIIGIPDGLLGNFRIDFAGEPQPAEPEPPIILHYNVRLQGDKLTEDPVIVQNTWTVANDWGGEERCPSLLPISSKKVDELSQCNHMVGTDASQKLAANGSTVISQWSSMAKNRSRAGRYFPFKQGYLSVMTVRVGEEGFHVTVDGKHISSFAYREGLEPWLVSEVRISGDLKLISVLASGLPTSEVLEQSVNVEALKSVPLPLHKTLDIFIGVFSTANNFKRRMAVRRTWMQYPAVKAGAVAVRFFVGLHKNQIVNEELREEVQTYGDIQLMPFIDYYSLITWKTIAISMFGTQAVSAKYVMKTDDDSFVRVDEVISFLSNSNVKHGLLYGLISSDACPHRNPASKWYISYEEWPESTYPPWAHGPGYVVSRDIAKLVYMRHKEGRLKMFQLEDVAMGIWVSQMKKEGLEVSYLNEPRIYSEGCNDGYVVAHYQKPSEMFCLWRKLREGNGAKCCGSR